MYITNIKTANFSQKEYHSIDLSQDNLTVEDLEQAFAQIESCKELRIRSKSLQQLPASLGNIKGLKVIHLTCEELTNIPDSFLPDGLEQFYLYQCKQLRSVPDRLFLQQNLRDLSIVKTPISIPQKIDLPKLNRLNLDIDDLQELPVELLPNSLFYLHLTSQHLREIPAVLSDCFRLMQLHIKAPLTKPLPNIQGLENLSHFQLQDIQFKDFGDDFSFPKKLIYLDIKGGRELNQLPDFSHLIYLREVSLAQLSHFPRGLEACPNLTRFTAVNVKDGALPDLSACTGLFYLQVNHCPLDHFPTFIFKLKKLRDIRITHTPIEHLPTTWEKLPELHSLDLSYNQLEVTDFEFMGALPKLTLLALDGNIINSLYSLISTKKVPLRLNSNYLSRIKYAKKGRYGYRGKKNPTFLEFCTALGRTKLDFSDKKWFFDLVANVSDVQELPDLDLSQFLKGLNINFKPLRLKLEKKLIQKVLIQHLSTLDIFQNPLVFELPAQLKKGDCLYITGQTIMPKSELKEQAEALGLTVVPRLSAQVSHVVLGKNSDHWQNEDSADFTIITERALRAYFSKIAPKYLEEAEQTGQEDMLRNVLELLAQEESQNVQIALEIMKGGGVPKLVLEDLLLLAKTNDDESIRQTAKELLELHAPASWMELIKNRLEFHQSKLIQSPAHIRKKLAQLSDTISPDIASFFTFLLQKKWQNQVAIQMELDDALYEIAKKLPIEEKLLVPNSVVFVNGTTRLKKTEIKEKLEAIGMSYAAKYSAKVSHLLIGNNPKTWDIEAADVSLLTENHLQTYLSQVSPQYLEQAAAEDDSTALTDNLEALLNSADTASVAVALEMMNTGGVPMDLLPSVLVVAKAESEAKIRAKARKLLELYAPADWLPMAKNKLLFKGITANAKESDLSNKLDKLAKESSFEMAAILSMALFKKYGRGLRFVLKKSNTSVYQEAVQLLLDGTHFNYSRGLGYKNWRGTDPSSVYLYGSFKSGINFPEKVMELGKIESIDFHNCKLSSMPRSITKFIDLKKLDCSHNSISKLPLGLHKLDKLEVLNLKMNMFTEFPLRLMELKNLKQVDLSYNRTSNAFVKLEVPEEVRVALPNCEFVL